MEKSLSSENFQKTCFKWLFKLLKSKNIFIFGNSGSGKSTLEIKVASFINAKLKRINFVDVSSSSTGNSDIWGLIAVF